jgi:hypothetical protein
MNVCLLPWILLVANVSAQQIVWIDNPVTGHRYGVGLTPTTWADGQALAVAHGGNLATIRSASEQAWIEANFAAYNTGSGLWIGFNDAQIEGQWVWVSGEPVTYTNWLPGEPNNAGGNEHYAHLLPPGAWYPPWQWNDHPGATQNTRPLIEITPPGSVPLSWVLSAATPPYGALHSSAVASRPGEFLVFGGFDTAPRNETWTFDGTAWVKRFSFANPAVRYDHAMAHDSARGETLLFGGRNLNFSAMPDTWIWDGFDWIRRYPVASPSSRYGHRLAFDVARGVTVLFGGRNMSTVFADTWTWDGVAWTQHVGNGPTPRFDHVFVYDSQRRRVVLYGGDSGTSLLDDLWEWDGAAWMQRTGLLGGPGPLADAASTYDQTQRRLVMHGGRTSTGPTNAAFGFSGAAWVRFLQSSGAPTRTGHLLAHVGGSRLWLLGGTTDTMWQTTLPAFARFTAFGIGCPGSNGTPSLQVLVEPSIGQDFVLGLQNAPLNFAIGAGALGFSNTQWSGFPLPAQLGFLGMPGCLLRNCSATGTWTSRRGPLRTAG